MVLSKYLAPLLQFALLVGGVLQVAVQDGVITAREAVAILVFAIAPAVTYLVPLAAGPWPGILKTGLNAVLGGALVVADVLDHGGWQWNANLLILVGLGVLNALAVEIGVGARLTSAAKGLADPNTSNLVVARADEGAYRITSLGTEPVGARHLGT